MIEIITALDGGYPFRMTCVPFYSARQSTAKRFFWLPAKFILDLRDIHVIAPIMPGAVRDKLDQFLVRVY